MIGRYSYTYDPAGNRLTQTDADGTNTFTQSFEYDRLHRLLRETPRAGVAGGPNTYSYDPAGNRTATGSGRGLVENDSTNTSSHPDGYLTWSTSLTPTSAASASGGNYTRLAPGQ